ncbi:MAG: hypothetical protein E7Z63_06125 [Thermoplasmata archaeon]|nr:hypothetical protein [Thermoplasmata archaeon]
MLPIDKDLVLHGTTLARKSFQFALDGAYWKDYKEYNGHMIRRSFDIHTCKPYGLYSAWLYTEGGLRHYAVGKNLREIKAIIDSEVGLREGSQ